MKFRIFSITKDDNDRRIDRVVRRFLPEMSLSGIYKLLRKGLIRVDGKKIRPDFHVLEGSQLGLAPDLAPCLLQQVRTVSKQPEESFLPAVLFESEDILFINKSAGIPVHGEGGLDRLIPQTLASMESLSFRTGPLHRLDRDTTGILAFSRSLEGARWFSRSVSAHLFEKYYLGIVEGLITEAAEWQDTSEDGKRMITLVQPLSSTRNAFSPLTLVRFRIITGRKHQIRIQGFKHGHTLAGDIRYGGSKNSGTYFLHAWQMVFPADRIRNIPETLCAPLPERFNSMIKKTFGEDVLAHIGQGELYWDQYEEHH